MPGNSKYFVKGKEYVLFPVFSRSGPSLDLFDFILAFWKLF